MNIFKSWFCKHKWKHEYNLSLPLNDDWPCNAKHVERCSNCNKERVVTEIIGARK
jgi:hypothetical protein